MRSIFAPVSEFAAKLEASRVAPELLPLLHAFSPVAGLFGEVNVVSDKTQWLQIPNMMP